MPTYALQSPADGQPVSYRAITPDMALAPGEVSYSGDMPPCPVWRAATSSVVSDPSKFGADGMPLPAVTAPAILPAVLLSWGRVKIGQGSQADLETVATWEGENPSVGLP